MDFVTEHMPVLGGAAAAGIAALAWQADRRRMRRADLDAVGLMPWTAVFFWSLMAAVLLLGRAATAWLQAS